ncbi:MAG: Big 5 protein [Acidobacteriota bacterium]|nr:Big 5 protein [Acidobacteriota bacterium]
MRRSPLTRQLALALAALLVTSCLTVQTRQRPITDVGGGADGHGGITLKVFADDDALKAGTPGPRGLFIELERREGNHRRPVFRSLEPAWSVMGLPPGDYLLRFPARLDEEGNAVRLDEEPRLVKVQAGEVTEVDTVLEHVDKGLIVAGVIAVVALAVFLDAHDLPVPPLPPVPPPPGLLDAVFWISLDAATPPVYGPPGGWVPAGPGRTPVVTSHFPPDGARVSADRVRITFALSAPLDAHTLQDDGITILGEKSGLLAGHTTYDGDRWWLVWEGDGDLPRGETFHITLAEDAVEDLAGNELAAPVSFSFETAQ